VTGLAASVGPVYDHLARLTDSRGLFEHAEGGEPRREHGYCLDDVARALVVVSREPDPDTGLTAAGRGYLDFVISAVAPDGACHNRMSVDGVWRDTPALGDWWGRGLWGLGVAAAHTRDRAQQARALLAFRSVARRRSPHLRAMAFAALGAGELLLARPDDPTARALLRDAVDAIGPARTDDAWPWPEARLAYANGSVVEALLLGGLALTDAAVADDGLLLLDFLLRTETRDGHLSVTPAGGRGPHDTSPAFDQQPIEVAAIADACARAYSMTGDDRWLDGVRMAWAWFLGDNDAQTPMVARSGAGYDGLQAGGHNLNQGAESSLAALSTAQHAKRLGLLA
jgi:hypothetical protein